MGSPIRKTLSNGTYLRLKHPLVLLDPDKKIPPEIYDYNRRANGLPLEKIQEHLDLIEKDFIVNNNKMIKKRKTIYRNEVSGKIERLYEQVSQKDSDS